MSCAKLNEEASMSAGERGNESEEGLRGEGSVDAGEEGGTRGEVPLSFGGCLEGGPEGLPDLG